MFVCLSFDMKHVWVFWFSCIHTVFGVCCVLKHIVLFVSLSFDMKYVWVFWFSCIHTVFGVCCVLKHIVLFVSLSFDMKYVWVFWFSCIHTVFGVCHVLKHIVFWPKAILQTHLEKVCKHFLTTAEMIMPSLEYGLKEKLSQP